MGGLGGNPTMTDTFQPSSTPERTGGVGRNPRFQRRLTDEPSSFRRTITGRWLLKLATYKPEFDGPAVELCKCSTCCPDMVFP